MIQGRYTKGESILMVFGGIERAMILGPDGNRLITGLNMNNSVIGIPVRYKQTRQ